MAIEIFSGVNNEIEALGHEMYRVREGEMELYVKRMCDKDGRPEVYSWMLDMYPPGAATGSMEFYYSLESLEADCRWVKGIANIHRQRESAACTLQSA